LRRLWPLAALLLAFESFAAGSETAPRESGAV
jgi:hypothetical protein